MLKVLYFDVNNLSLFTRLSVFYVQFLMLFIILS